MRKKLIYILRVEIRKQSIALLTSAGSVHRGCFKYFAALCMSTNDCKSATNINVGVTSIFQWVGKFSNIDSMHNEEKLYYENPVV